MDSKNTRQAESTTVETSIPAMRLRIIVAVILGIACGGISFLLQRRPGFWPDFVFPWAAARYLLQGRDPYLMLPGGLKEPFETPLLYPLPTVLAVVPFARLSMAAAGGVVMGLSSAILGFVLTRRGWHNLWMLASAPFVMAVSLGQWSPLIVVAALQPTLGALASLKPNIGLAAFAYRPTWNMVIGGVIVFIASLVVLPAWPLEWLHAVRSLPGHPAPLFIAKGTGLVLLLCLLKWRTPEGRLLLVSACIPQLPFFADQLPLLLIARTRLELIALTALSQVGFLCWFLLLKPDEAYVPRAAPYVLAFIFIPVLVLVLRRPNESSPARD
jgi:hypothetical protein